MFNTKSLLKSRSSEFNNLLTRVYSFQAVLNRMTATFAQCKTRKHIITVRYCNFQISVDKLVH